jgi:hypothetical protein
VFPPVGDQASADAAADACKYQLFFFAGNSVKLREVWQRMSDRKKKELVHFDRKYKSISVFLSKSCQSLFVFLATRETQCGPFF